MIVFDMTLLRFLRWVGWNFLLAIIPVVLAYFISWLYLRFPLARRRLWLLWLLLGFLWLAFLPNTGYLLTGWRHFLGVFYREGLYAQWNATRDVDTLLRMAGYALFFLFYSGFGLVTFTLAVRPFALLLRARWRQYWLAGIPLFLLSSFGIYLGLIPRLNSWDIMHRPSVVFDTALAAVTHVPLLLLVILFAAALWVGYWIVDVWIDGWWARTRHGDMGMRHD